MPPPDLQLAPSGSRSYRALGATRMRTPPPGGAASQVARLLAMNTRLESRLRTLLKDRERLSRLLTEADAALAAAGVPYLQDNIRERISAYHVFHVLESHPW